LRNGPIPHKLRERLLYLAREWMRAVVDKEDVVMNKRAATFMRSILTSVVRAMLIFSKMPPLYAQSNLHMDSSGYTTGTIGSKV
jgi:hypothetical protein